MTDKGGNLDTDTAEEKYHEDNGKNTMYRGFER